MRTLHLLAAVLLVTAVISAALDHSKYCEASPFGAFSDPVNYQHPAKDTTPCPNHIISRVSTRMTLSFDIYAKTMDVIRYNFKIQSKKQPDNVWNMSTQQNKDSPQLYLVITQNALDWHLGIDTGDLTMVHGVMYRMKYVFDSDRVHVFVDGKHRNTVLTPLFACEDCYVTFAPKSTVDLLSGVIRGMKLQNNVVEIPGKSNCVDNPAGLFAENAWSQPMKGFLPCPDTYFPLSNRYTIKFDLKVNGIIDVNGSIFRITQSGKNCCGPKDRQPTLFLPQSTNQLELSIATETKGDTSLNPTYKFAIGVEHKVQIQVDTDTVVIRVNNVEITNQKVGRVYTATAAQVFFGDDFLPTPNAEVKNFSIYNGGRICVRVWSECQFQGEYADICEDTPSLVDQGWNHIIKSVQIPKDFDQVVTLYTEDNYTQRKVELSQSARCLRKSSFSFLQTKANGQKGQQQQQYKSIKFTSKKEK